MAKNGKSSLKLSDLVPDRRNANLGTPRGMQALESSLQKYGAGRSILIDKHNRILAGNKTWEKAGELGLDELIVVQTDGTKVVAVQRVDLDLETDKEARELAFADNRVGQLDLDFDPEEIARSLTEGVDLSALWTQDELDALMVNFNPVGVEEQGRLDELNEKPTTCCPECGHEFTP